MLNGITGSDKVGIKLGRLKTVVGFTIVNRGEWL